MLRRAQHERISIEEFKDRSVRPFDELRADSELVEGLRKDFRQPLRSIFTAAIIVYALCSTAANLFAGHGVEDTVDSISADRVKQLIDAGEKLTLIDMRPLKEYQQKRLPGARSIPLGEVANRFNEIPKAGRVVLYCDCKPYDVADRAVFLEYRGFRNIFIMPEGYEGWVKRGYPLESPRR